MVCFFEYFESSRPAAAVAKKAAGSNSAGSADLASARRLAGLDLESKGILHTSASGSAIAPPASDTESPQVMPHSILLERAVLDNSEGPCSRHHRAGSGKSPRGRLAAAPIWRYFTTNILALPLRARTVV